MEVQLFMNTYIYSSCTRRNITGEADSDNPVHGVKYNGFQNDGIPGASLQRRLRTKEENKASKGNRAYTTEQPNHDNNK